MTILEELNNLAEKMTGENPHLNDMSDVINFISEKTTGTSSNEQTVAVSLKYLADNYKGGSGGGASEYFRSTLENSTDSEQTILHQITKKTPEIIVSNEVESLMYGFQSTNAEVYSKVTCGSNVTELEETYGYCGNAVSIDASGYNTENVYTFNSMFVNCKSLASLDLSNFVCGNNASISQMFSGCNSLQHLDMRNFEFSKITNSSNYRSAFNGVPTTCEIIVKDDTEKQWFATNFSNLTNVKTVAEL